MAVNAEELKATPPDDERAFQLLNECRSRLGGEWRLLSSSQKLRKTLVEAEYNGRPVIGKASRSKRSRTAFGSITALWDAGMRPPSMFTVPEPIAWFDDLMFLVVEKAPGESVLDAMQQGNGVEDSVRSAGLWLAAMHALKVDVKPDRFDVAAAQRRAAELASALDNPTIVRIAGAAIRMLGTEPASVVPSHGDYHPMNIFVAPGRVTAIDLDTVGLRDADADVGYFLAQTANFGLQMFDSFDATREIREAFLGCCPQADMRRVSAHMAWTLLQSLHYDACILKIKNERADLMVQAAVSVLRTGSLDPAEE
jgi:aminoglycoside phosphotransferase (APT) family kinase protein